LYWTLSGSDFFDVYARALVAGHGVYSSEMDSEMDEVWIVVGSSVRIAVGGSTPGGNSPLAAAGTGGAPAEVGLSQTRVLDSGGNPTCLAGPVVLTAGIGYCLGTSC
jgi:hypothetical protein